METFTLASGEVMTRAHGERYWKCNGKGRYWRHGDTFVRVGRPSREEADELTSRLGGGLVAMIHPRPLRRR